MFTYVPIHAHIYPCTHHTECFWVRTHPYTHAYTHAYTRMNTHTQQALGIKKYGKDLAGDMSTHEGNIIPGNRIEATFDAE